MTEDVRHVLTLGRKQVLKCLLYVQKQFNNTEAYHIHNKLFIADYCVWIQTVSEATLRSLSNTIKHCQLNKDNMELGICDLEREFLEESDAETEDTSSSEESSSEVDSDDSDPEERESSSLTHLEQELSSLCLDSVGNQEKIKPRALIQVIDENSTD